MVSYALKEFTDFWVMMQHAFMEVANLWISMEMECLGIMRQDWSSGRKNVEKM